MANVIEFPSPGEREQREVKEMLFARMKAAGFAPSVRECTYRAIKETTDKYRIPQLQFSFTGPIPDDTLRAMTAALRAWHKREVVAFANRAVNEICRLKFELCKAGRSVE